MENLPRGGDILYTVYGSVLSNAPVVNASDGWRYGPIQKTVAIGKTVDSVLARREGRQRARLVRVAA